MKFAAVIVAAGKGLRFGQNKPKQFLNLAGRPVLAHSISVFENHAQIAPIIVLGAADWLVYIAEEIVDKYALSKVKRIVSGGAERKDSVRAGHDPLEMISGPLLFHGGTRPVRFGQLVCRVIA